MASLQKNVASQSVTFAFVNATSGAALTGATAAGKKSVDGAAQASVGGSFSELGLGQYLFSPSQTDTNGTSIGYLFTATNAIPVNLHFFTDVVDANGLLKVDTEDWKGTAVSSPAAAGVPDINVKAINNVALAAQALAQSTQSICGGTCSGGTTTTAVVSTLNNPSSLTDAGQLIGRTIIFLGNTTTTHNQSQASNITANTTGATPTITFTAMTNAPANGDVFVVI